MITFESARAYASHITSRRKFVLVVISGGRGVIYCLSLSSMMDYSKGTSDVLLFVVAHVTILVGSHINSLETLVILSQHDPNFCLTKLVFV